MSWAAPEDLYLSTSLASYLDKKLLILLRDGRKLMGTLRSFDQFANAVLEGACERVIVGDLYCDIPLGLYVIRGENVVLIGEMDVEREELPPHMTRVPTEEIRRVNTPNLNFFMIFCVYFVTLFLPSLEVMQSCGPTGPFMAEVLIIVAQKVERDASELKGTMRKRMEFLDLD